MKIIRIILVLTIFVPITGCDTLMTKYPFETDPDQLKSRTLIEYFENSQDKSRTIFCAAVRRAGLVDEITGGNITCVVPNNGAWTSFLNVIGASSIDEVDPAVLRALIRYLVFPGDYRALTMTQGENVRVESLSGDPIWIMRSPSTNDKYRMVINDNKNELASSAVVVYQQDYLFKDNVVAQVVQDFVTYQPKVLSTFKKPENFDDSEAKRDTLFVTDDCHIYRNSSAVNNNYNSNQAMALCARAASNSYRVGLFKIKLKPIDFAEDIIKAEFTGRIAYVATYDAGAECQIDFHSLGNVNWTESTATYNSVDPALQYPVTTSNYLTSATFTVPGAYTSETACQQMFQKDTTLVNWDITGHIMNAYEAAGENADTPLAFALYDNSQGYDDAGTTIRLCMKDYLQNTNVHSFLSYVAITGPLPSNLRLRNNNVVVVRNEMVALTPDVSFAMEGPAYNDGYNYANHNIVYILKSLPAQGILTKYSIPMKRNEKFTQAEMAAGVIKYLKKGSGQDSFAVSATDYLGGIYYADEAKNVNTITVNINL